MTKKKLKLAQETKQAEIIEKGLVKDMGEYKEACNRGVLDDAEVTYTPGEKTSSTPKNVV